MYTSCQHQPQCYVLENRQIYKSCLSCSQDQKEKILFNELVNFQGDTINIINEIKKLNQHISENMIVINESFNKFQNIFENDYLQFPQLAPSGYDEKLLDFYLNKKFVNLLKIQKKITKDINTILQKGKKDICSKIKSYQKQQKEELRLKFLKQQRLENNLETSVYPNLNSFIASEQLIKNKQINNLTDNQELIHIQDYFKFDIQYKIQSVTFLNEYLIGIAFDHDQSFYVYNILTKSIHHIIDQPQIYDSWRIQDNKFVIGQGNTIKMYRIDNNLQIISDNIEFLNSTCQVSKIFYNINDKLLTLDNKNCIRQKTVINEWNLRTGELLEYNIQGKANEIINISSSKQLFVGSVVHNKELKRSNKLTYQIELWKFDGNEKRINKIKVDQQINSLSFNEEIDQLIGFGENNAYIWQIVQDKKNSYSFLLLQKKIINIPTNINRTLYLNEILFVGTTNGKLLKLIPEQGNQQILDLKSKIVKISSFNNLNVISSENNLVVIFKIP